MTLASLAPCNPITRGKRVGHIIGGMILMMVDRRVRDIDELKALLASSDVLMFKGNLREEIYAWIERTLRSYRYRSRPRLEKGVLRQYMRKITGISNSQLTRLITQFRRSGHVRIKPYKRHSFPTKYTREDLNRPGFPGGCVT